MIGESLDVGGRERGLERDRLVQPAAADVAQEPVREASLSARADRSVDHAGCVDPDPGVGRVDREAVGAVGETHRLRQPLAELGLQQLPGGGRAQSPHVDAGDLDALGDQVGAALIPEIGIGAARGDGDTAHGRDQACSDQ